MSTSLETSQNGFVETFYMITFYFCVWDLYQKYIFFFNIRFGALHCYTSIYSMFEIESGLNYICVTCCWIQMLLLKFQTFYIPLLQLFGACLKFIILRHFILMNIQLFNFQIFLGYGRIFDNCQGSLWLLQFWLQLDKSSFYVQTLTSH